MKVTKLPLDGLLLIEPRPFADDRGYFLESFNMQVFGRSTGLNVDFVQDNQSQSKKGVMRGLHFQLPPYGQDKLVRAIHGTILDVAVDLRKNSSTYLQHYKVELSAENYLQLYIPFGFAHGFVSLTEGATIAYKCTGFYHKESDSGIAHDDPEIGIDWSGMVDTSLISDKDRSLPTISQFDNPF